MFWKFTIVMVAVAGVGAAIYLSGVSRAHVINAWKYIEKTAKPGEHPTAPEPTLVALKPLPPWDGLVTVTEDEKVALGLATAPVAPQTKPMILELTGRTAYDPDTLTKIRPRFDTLVERVHATLGQKVKNGDKLVELHSTDLAAAKSDFQSKYVQWRHDFNLLTVRRDLVNRGAISKKEFVDTQNDEQKSRLDYILAGDRLRVFKVPEADIEALLKGLGEATTPDTQQFGSVEDKAKMTLLSPVDGIVIEREVVPQNFYQDTDVLMVIAPLDHLWVLLNVYELDQDKVKLGQTLDIEFPFLAEKIVGKVQYVASEVSKDTRAVRVRASIPNPGARLKSDMLVKAMLEIPPVKGQTVIPRMAVVSSGGTEFVFVRKDPADAALEAGDKDSLRKGVLKFERRAVDLAQESHDVVIVRRGLNPG